MTQLPLFGPVDPPKPERPAKVALDKPPAPVGLLRAKGTACRSCGQKIVFALVTRKVHGQEVTKPHPYDPEPDPDGTTHLVVDGRRIMAYPIPKSARGGRLTLHLSHFKHCPDAGQWRTGGPRDEPEG